MRCPIESQEDAAVLLDYCARTLDAATAALLERHIEICPACQTFQQEQQAVWRALDDWETSRVSPDFDRRLYRRIEAEAATPWWTRMGSLSWVSWKPAVPLAAICLTLVAAAIFDSPAELPSPDTRGQVRVETVQVDQMERTLEDLEMLSQFDLVTTANVSNTGSL